MCVVVMGGGGISWNKRMRKIKKKSCLPNPPLPNLSRNKQKEFEWQKSLLFICDVMCIKVLRWNVIIQFLDHVLQSLRTLYKICIKSTYTYHIHVPHTYITYSYHIHITHSYYIYMRVSHTYHIHVTYTYHVCQNIGTCHFGSQCLV